MTRFTMEGISSWILVILPIGTMGYNEIQMQQHKRTQENTKIFPRETTRKKTSQNFLSIEFVQDSVKLQTKTSSFFMMHYHFSLLLRTT